MPKRPVVIALGPGRSGTSMLMQILHAQGMNVSTDTVPVDVSNPMGFFEDREIVATHNVIFDILGLSSFHLHTLTRHDLIKIAPQKEKIKEIISASLQGGNGLWGFKDPRISALLPLWDQILGELDLSPRYILCLRNPGSVVESMKQHYNREDNVSELTWLVRTVQPLVSHYGDMFLLHYEDWFLSAEKRTELASRLFEFVSLPQKNVADVLAKIIKPALNRSEVPYAIKNPYVSQLYTALVKQGSGNNVSPSIKKLAMESKSIVDFFSTASLDAQKASIKRHEKSLHAQKEETIALAKEKESLSLDIKKLKDEIARIHDESQKKLKDEIARIQNENQNLVSELKKEAEQERLQHAKTVNNLNADIKQLGDKRRDIETQAAQQRLQHENEIAKLAAEHTEKMSSIKLEMNQQRLQYEENASTLRDEIRRLNETSMNSLTKMRTQYEEKISAFHDEIKRLNETNASALTEMQSETERKEFQYQEEISRLTSDIKNLYEKHRTQTLRLKEARDEVERLRVAIHARPAPAKPDEKQNVAAKVKDALPTPATAERKEVKLKVQARPVKRRAPLGPTARKIRKLVRTPKLFFSDWHAKRFASR